MHCLQFSKRQTNKVAKMVAIVESCNELYIHQLSSLIHMKDEGSIKLASQK